MGSNLKFPVRFRHIIYTYILALFQWISSLLVEKHNFSAKQADFKGFPSRFLVTSGFSCVHEFVRDMTA